MVLSTQDLEDLTWAKRHLELPHAAERVARVLGAPWALVNRKIPATWRTKIDMMSHEALRKDSVWVLGTLDVNSRSRQSILHMAGGMGNRIRRRYLRRFEPFRGPYWSSLHQLLSKPSSLRRDP